MHKRKCVVVYFFVCYVSEFYFISLQHRHTTSKHTILVYCCFAYPHKKRQLWNFMHSSSPYYSPKVVNEGHFCRFCMHQDTYLWNIFGSPLTHSILSFVCCCMNAFGHSQCSESCCFLWADVNSLLQTRVLDGKKEV